jgi:cellulose synthase/poly-beta-1,6-N-acetylglucosamine synthase-like glycosyltransferase
VSGDGGAPVRALSLLARSLFGLSCTLIGYTWVLYPLGLKALSSLKRDPAAPEPREWPSLSAVTCAYNEEAVIRQKVENLLSLDYPRDRLQILIVSDGSEDATDAIIREYADRGVELHRQPRGGTTSAFNAAVQRSRGEVIVHSDADTLHAPDYLRLIARHYADPKVGVVEGEFRFRNEDATGLAQNQGLYWRFEMFLRHAESKLGVLSTTSGAIMSFRRDVFEPFEPHHSVDGTLPKLAIQKGYRVVHEPDALAYEVMVQSVRGEFRARVRQTSRTLLSWSGSEFLLDPLKTPGVSVALISHKILRWFTSVFMVVAFVSNLPLLGRRFYKFSFAAQLAFYGSALVGYLLELRDVRVRLFSAPFSFCLANLGFLIGIWKAVRQQRIAVYRSEE